MLLSLLEQLGVLSDSLGAAFDKITLRAAFAAIVGFLPAILFGRWWIGWLEERFREPNRSASETLNQLHAAKDKTPTMGGLVIVVGLLAAAVLFGDWTNPYLLIGVFLVLALAGVGAIDDLIKLHGGRRGLSARRKFAAQTAIAIVAAVLLYWEKSGTPGGLTCGIPMLPGGLSLGIWFIPLAVLVIVGTSNAVNLTDGLDGLAGGCLLFSIGAMTVVVYACGHAGLAEYLNLGPVRGVGEMTILSGAALGAVLGFLWFNCHPAEVFMGDTGSLPLGGLLGLLAVASGQPLLLVVVGGVFVAEALSVILQVGSYKLWRRRVFRCAPLHHHFQFAGQSETKIVVRFWIASALCAVLGLAVLKLDIRDVGQALPSPDVTAAVESPSSDG